ncbi:MAG: PAS domain S-box protein [Pseudomonadota bacterium]
MKAAYILAWMTILAFVAWSGNLLMEIQTNWEDTNEIHAWHDDLDILRLTLQNLNRPGNDVLEHYYVERNRQALARYTRDYEQSLTAVERWSVSDSELQPLVNSLKREQAGLMRYANEILVQAEQREQLRTGGAEQEAIREKETTAATAMARMDQAFQNCLQLLLSLEEAVEVRDHLLESQQRWHFKQLYLMLFVALLASGLSVELVRRTMRQREALRDSSARINAIMNNVVDGIITVDDTGRIESSNPAADALFGQQERTLVGQQFTDLLGNCCRARYQELVAGNMDTVREPFPLTSCEDTSRCGHAACFPMELALSHVTVQGRHLRVHIIRDITARRQAERELRQAASVFENINEGIMVTDAQGALLSVNPAFTAMTQYSREEVLGKTPRILHSGRHDREFYRDMWQAIIENGQWQGEIWNRRKNGEIYPQWLTINAVKDGNGQLINYLGVTWDITELKSSERMKEEFITTVSHELRTPLTSVLGSLGMLMQGDGGPIPEQARRLIQMAYSNSGRLVRLVGDILDFEKMSTGRMNFHLRTLKLMPLIQQTIESNRTLSEQSGISIELVEALDDVRITCDAERLMQAVTNLLSNAIKFSPRGSRVEVAVCRRHPMIRIAVSDQGPGIPEQFRPEIFEKFTQLNDRHQEQKGGIGLGLSIAKLIVQKHNGVIDFESEPGVRTTFFIDLPELRSISGGKAVAPPRRNKIKRPAG